jgi:CheY-like chemotaxis protein
MNLTIDPEPRPSSVRLAGCIRRGDMVAAAAAEYCAAGERGAAWQAYCLAQSQYRSATEMLILSPDLIPCEREEMQAELVKLRETLAKLYVAINDVRPDRIAKCQGPDTPNPEIFRREVLAAGGRLSDALKLEAEFGGLSAADTECVHAQLGDAQKLVDLSQQDYDRALMRYRDDLLRSSDSPEAPLCQKTVLVLEDEQSVALFLKTVLEKCGSRVLHAATGELAVTLCEHHHGAIDLVIADVILSGGTYGIDVARRLARYGPALPVLFISGHSRDDLVNHGLLDPGNGLFRKTDFLQKPFSPSLLATRVRLLLNA